MPKHDPTKEALDALAAFAHDPASPAAVALYIDQFKKGTSLAVAKAAQMAMRADQRDLMPLMAEAFPRFMKRLPGSDRNCAAKIALAEALDTMGWDDWEPFLRGVGHVQMEGTFGPPEDRAASLRGRCAAALVRLRHRDAPRYIADLLYDPWLDARRGAVRAAAYLGGNEGELLLRCKVHAGMNRVSGEPIEDPEVFGLCFAELLRLALHSSLPVVASFLPGKSALSRWSELRLLVGDEAALALAECREEAASQALCEAYRQTHRAQWLLPLALTRDPDAVRLLLTEVRHGLDAVRAIDALCTARMDESTEAALAEAVAARDDPKVTAAWEG